MSLTESDATLLRIADGPIDHGRRGEELEMGQKLPRDTQGANAMAGWTKQASLLGPRDAHDTATVNGHILVVGGLTDFTQPVLDSVEARRIAGKGTWHSLPRPG
jgi:hypothetical protein